MLILWFELETHTKFYNGLVKSLKAKLENWKKYRPIRGMIEDIFKSAKDAFSLKKLHRYTKRSVKKIRLFACTFGRDSGIAGY